MNYKDEVLKRFPSAECMLHGKGLWCIYETLDTIYPLNKLGRGSTPELAWQDALSKHSDNINF